MLLQQQERNTGIAGHRTILFTEEELEKATNNFNMDRILSEGAQGIVYKVMLTNGRTVAIKKSQVVDLRHVREFINEMAILTQVNHRNVVTLLGCCLETEVPLLVFEFISNGSLTDLIHNTTAEQFPFSLNHCLQIATEVTRAISYLHGATSTPIYHMDMKSTNILLDENYRAKVTDFGILRFLTTYQTHLTTQVNGTDGYMDPHYYQTGRFTEKSDVYSFAVVLLEILTRKKAVMTIPDS